MKLRKLAALGVMVTLVAGFAAADTALVYHTFLRREFVMGELERLTGRPVKLGRVSFGPFKGLVADGVEILKRDQSPFLKAERIRVVLDRGELLQGRVAIASVELEKPMARLEIGKDGSGELMELLGEVARRASSTKGGPIPRISVRGGEFVFADAALMTDGGEIRVRDVNADILPYGPDRFVVQGGADAGALGRWTIEGKIDASTGRSEMHLDSKGLEVSERVFEPFGEEVQRVYRMYNAQGPIEVAVTGSYNPAESPAMRMTADVTPRGISIEYAGFRYKVLNVEGLLRLKDDGIEFRNMSAKFWPTGDGRESAAAVRGEQPVTISMNGSTDGYVAESAYNLDFSIAGLKIDAKLREALQADARNVFDLFHPAGHLQGRVQVHKAHGKGVAPVHDIDMAMVDCSATFQPFPLPVSDVTGLIVMRGEELSIQGARCRHGDAWFSVNGHLTSMRADGGIEVTVDTDAVALTEAAKQALPEPVRKVWDHFDPEGSIGFHWVTRREPGADRELAYDVTLFPRGVTAQYDGVPYAVTGLRGEIWTDAKSVEVRRLTGKHGTAQVDLRGTVKGLDAEPAYDLTLNAEEIPVDGDLLAAIPGDFAKAIADIKLKGVLKIDALRFRKGGEALGPGESAYDAKSIQLYEGAFDAGLKFRDAYADLWVEGLMGPGFHHLKGQLRNTRMRVEDLKVALSNAIVELEGPSLRFNGIEGTCYEGRLEGMVSVDTKSSGWEIVLKMADVNLSALAGDSSFAGKNITGKASAALKLRGKGGDPKSFSGAGGLSFRDSELWNVPVLAGAFANLKLGKADVFDRGYVNFSVESGRMQISAAQLQSKSLDLTTEKGSWMDFGGKLGMLLRPSIKDRGILGLPLKVIDKIIEGSTAVRVQGTFANPEVGLEPRLDILRMIGLEPEPEEAKDPKK
ncbi:MAG: hypothetical protein K8T20_20165 [Planctomycetes bacterium]|nr:hypothetical protein [Planctomycetota bacterium]